jgi:hypothetical protein
MGYFAAQLEPVMGYFAAQLEPVMGYFAAHPPVGERRLQVLQDLQAPAARRKAAPAGRSKATPWRAR